METLKQDLRFAVRMLLKSPGFTAVAVLSMALGIGVNTMIFSVVNAALLRALPFEDTETLAMLAMVQPRRSEGPSSFSFLDFDDFRRQVTTLELAAHRGGGGLVLAGVDEPERVDIDAVSANLFPMLGVQPILGRTFTAGEDVPGGPDVILLSHDLWQRRFNGDPAIVGRKVLANATPYTVVGVMPPGFNFPDLQQAWVPVATQWKDLPRSRRTLQVVARLKPGATVEEARAEVKTVASRLEAQHPESNTGWSATVRPLREKFMGENLVSMLSVLSGAVAFVLLIACANVANLLLARAADRRREIAVRAALGAGRRRIVRQLLTENVLVALAGGALGILVALWGIGAIERAFLGAIPYWLHFSIDLPVLLYTFAVSAAAGLLFGLVPALQTSRIDLHETLKQGGRGGSGTAGARLRTVLVVAEVAIALVLLVGTSLVARSFLALARADLGFETSNLLTLRTHLPGDVYEKAEARTRRIEDILRRVQGLPGVESAAAGAIPLYSTGIPVRIQVEGREDVRGEEPMTPIVGTSADYFRTIGIPLVRGRLMTAAEHGERSRLAVVNETFVRRFFPRVDPIGRRFRSLEPTPEGKDDDWITIVGVVADVQLNQIESPMEPVAFAGFPYHTGRPVGLVVRTRLDPMQVALDVGRQIRASDPGLPMFQVHSLDELRGLRLTVERLIGKGFALFGGIALFLAGVGVYGVLSYSVHQRRREIGVRVAMGARRRHVFGMVLGRGLALSLIGIGVGLAGAFALTRVLARMLYAVSPTDPASYAMTSAVLLAVALVACYLPASRATEVEPQEALRAD